MAKVELRTVVIEDTEHYPGAKISVTRTDQIYVSITQTPTKKSEDPTVIFAMEDELIDLYIAIGQFLELKKIEASTKDIPPIFDTEEKEP